MRTCKVCRQKYEPARPLQSTCSIPCALAWGTKAAEKKAKRDALAEKKSDALRKKALKTRSDWIKEAQAAFNKFVRLRDTGTPCISCGAPLWGGGVGGGFDAGHWRSVGSAPHLRFDERNCHGQCKRCNRYGAGMAVDYRLGLAVRLGLSVVEALEGENGPAKFTIPELQTIRDTYKAKAKELEKDAA